MINVLGALRGLMSLVIIRTVIYHAGSLSDLSLPWQRVTHRAFKNIVLFIQRDLLQLDRKEWLRYHKIWFKSQTPTVLPDLWRFPVLHLYLVINVHLGLVPVGFVFDISQARKAVMWANCQKPEVNGPNACLLMRIQRHSGKLNAWGPGLNYQGTHQESHWEQEAKLKKNPRKTDFKINPHW